MPLDDRAIAGSKYIKPRGAIQDCSTQDLALHYVSDKFKETPPSLFFCRKALDVTITGPTSFCRRRKDGTLVPTLDVFMTGNRNLFKMDIPSKTLENRSGLVRNGLEVWQEVRTCMRTRVQADGRTETTIHLLFECKNYREPL
jgi:hypothetical protein